MIRTEGPNSKYLTWAGKINLAKHNRRSLHKIRKGTIKLPPGHNKAIILRELNTISESHLKLYEN